MRIWDVPVEDLCRKHLLGEHRELHGLWSILTNGKAGYSKHPETKRWVGHLRALQERHSVQVREMERRGYNHRSPLEGIAYGPAFPPEKINTLVEQRALLAAKNCECYQGENE